MQLQGLIWALLNFEKWNVLLNHLLPCLLTIVSMLMKLPLRNLDLIQSPIPTIDDNPKCKTGVETG